MNVTVEIERLVVEGFEGLDGRALGRAVERELTRRLGEAALEPAHLERLGEAVPVHSVELPLGADAGVVGSAAAGAVADLLGAPAGPPSDAGRSRR